MSPLLKKSDLDFELEKNYRPVSNLKFISKTTERVACSFIVDHIKTHNLFSRVQSAYRSYHSTETALLSVQNDILRAVDKFGAVLLVLLDLSAAFDTIDHNLLLLLLEKSFGLSGTVLLWIKSYISARSQSVRVGKAISEVLCLLFGVPQGSVLGPILFILYTTSLGKVIDFHKLAHHFYADDTQLWVYFNPKVESSVLNAVHAVETCCKDIRAWMQYNKLKLNDDKTELLAISANPSELLNISVKIGEHTIDVTELSPRNLGVLFDARLAHTDNIAKVSKTIRYNLQSISKIRNLLTKPDTEKLVYALATSRLDYCNSLLAGSPYTVIQPLQLVQNYAARVISCTRKYDRVSPVLRELHWLPVRQRVYFKVLLLTYKALHGEAPPYLRDELHNYECPREGLRPKEDRVFDVPDVKRTFGERAFSYSAPRLWNALPKFIRDSLTLDQFKKQLKTYLFSNPNFPPPIVV